MQIGCDTFLNELEAWAPLSFAEEWDNCGLQVGRRDKVVRKVMVALTPGEAAIQAAVDAGADMLLTHHPMIFKPAKSVTTDTVLGQSIMKLIQHDINLYCAHTNLDMAVGGVNEKNVADFLKAGMAGAGIGGNLANKDWIEAGEYHKITETAQKLVAAVKGV